MGDQDGVLGSFISSVLPNLSEHQQVVEALSALGVETLDDMKYIQEADLLGVLKPIEARKIMAHIKATCKFLLERLCFVPVCTSL